jgi:hypothetical protein
MYLRWTTSLECNELLINHCVWPWNIPISQKLVLYLKYISRGLGVTAKWEEWLRSMWEALLPPSTPPQNIKKLSQKWKSISNRPYFISVLLELSILCVFMVGTIKYISHKICVLAVFGIQFSCIKYIDIVELHPSLLPSFSTAFFFSLVGLGFELRALCFQSRCYTTWTIPPVHFVLLILEMGISGTVCPDWLRTAVLTISASQVASITGKSHQCQGTALSSSQLQYFWKRWQLMILLNRGKLSFFVHNCKTFLCLEIS